MVILHFPLGRNSNIILKYSLGEAPIYNTWWKKEFSCTGHCYLSYLCLHLCSKCLLEGCLSLLIFFLNNLDENNGYHEIWKERWFGISESVKFVAFLSDISLCAIQHRRKYYRLKGLTGLKIKTILTLSSPTTIPMTKTFHFFILQTLRVYHNWRAWIFLKHFSEKKKCV